MPKVEKRTARKDYPKDGIAKGDTYYYTKLKTQRGGIVKRSKTPFKPSQLTQSPFISGWLAMQEEWEASDKTAEPMREAAQAIRELGDEAQGSFDNMPEGLQQGETGQLLEARASGCAEAADLLDGLADDWDGLEEPEEPTDEEEAENESARDEYESALAEYESEQERITEEADGIVGNMPEG